MSYLYPKLFYDDKKQHLCMIFNVNFHFLYLFNVCQLNSQ